MSRLGIILYVVNGIMFAISASYSQIINMGLNKRLSFQFAAN